MDLALDARTMNATEVTLAHDGTGDPRDLLAFSAMMRLQATRYLAHACQCPDEIQSDAAVGATMAVVLIEACLSLFSFQRLGEPWWAARCVCGVPDHGHDKYRLRNGEIDIESVHIQTFGISRGVDTAKSLYLCLTCLLVEPPTSHLNIGHPKAMGYTASHGRALGAPTCTQFLKCKYRFFCLSHAKPWWLLASTEWNNDESTASCRWH
jgi:hypothetical protein